MLRYIMRPVINDLKKKMVFIGGPRQVGKTTLAKAINKKFEKGLYFNWDYDDDRHLILQKRWREDDQLIIFDELHKYIRWKNWIKGIYDHFHQQHSFLVTGSARLDIYRRGGDSLVGRYHYWRLHPFSLDEIPKKMQIKEALKRLMTLGGFPEPFLDGHEGEARRWRRERLSRVLKEDVRDLEPLKNIQLVSLYLDLLRERAGSLINFSNLARDLQISPKTAKYWAIILERMYLLFWVRPYTKSSSRSILKAPKFYFFDNGDVIGDEGSRFENLIACLILKKLHYKEDLEGYRYDLNFIRDKEGREVDFAIVKEGKLEQLIEVKFSDDKISKSLLYFANKLKPNKVIQVVATLKRPYDQNGVNIVDPFTFQSLNI